MQTQQAERIGPDRLRVPMRAEGPGDLEGDGMVEIGPDHPQYQQWAAWLDRRSRPAR